MQFPITLIIRAEMDLSMIQRARKCYQVKLDGDRCDVQCERSLVPLSLRLLHAPNTSFEVVPALLPEEWPMDYICSAGLSQRL